MRTLRDQLAGRHLLIFDFDGTLADTTPLHSAAFTDVLKPCGVPVDYAAIAGRKTADAILLAFKLAKLSPPSPSDLAALVTSKQLRVREAIANELSALPGAEAFLAWAKPRFTLALVTSGSRGTVNLALKRLGWQLHFPYAVFAEDVTCAKPDPEGFNLALQLTGTAPRQALVFEDSEAGFAAAAAAGIEFVDARVALHTGDDAEWRQ